MNKPVPLLFLIPLFFSTYIFSSSQKLHNNEITSLDRSNNETLEIEITNHTDFLDNNGKIIVTNLAQIINHIFAIMVNPKNFLNIAPNVGSIINNIINIAITIFKKHLPNASEDELKAYCYENLSEEVKEEVTRLCIKRFQKYC